MLPGSQEKADHKTAEEPDSTKKAQRTRRDMIFPSSLLSRKNRSCAPELNTLNLSSMMATDLVNDISVEDRLRGTVWGQFVGDAAALGTHWIYNLSDLQRLYPSGVNGFEEPKEGHYHFGKRPGDQTHYGDGALVLLESLAKEGGFDPKAFGRRFVESFQPGLYSGYIDKATRGTLENY